ncbi:E3 ubiquitin-protein ligase At3g02290-like isoform X2 [Zingiber officinale]|uniref:E3 ubiquitin-protein ligase At3g02290-like isoform X2 n=1 Tax=Zingiber officinale TaxID=94328 RepID=UPI001C4D1345|nr:E3 ubiquitin-protein ligase At3g02290-like isoform X2 [Zingiber officinale]
MGCVGSCLRENKVEGQEHRNRRRSFVQLVVDMYHSLFPSRERVVPSAEQGLNIGENNAAVLLSNDNPRSSQPQAQQDSLVLGHTKDNTVSPLLSNDPRGSHSQRQNEDLVSGHAVIPEGVQKSVSIRYEKGTNTQPDPNYENGSISGSSQMLPYLYLSSDVEDSCPICLEDYTIENPRSTLQCAHQFHLCCIYEWMERSHACPFCSKIMLFKEDP